MKNITIANPGYRAFASFTSGGPRRGDSHLKPDITAPGVSILSTDMGTGNGGARNSGTSMAAPHVSGVAALVKQAHPGWSSEELRSAIVTTADPDKVKNLVISRGGTGLVQPFPATRTSAVVFGDDQVSSLSFGFAELTDNFDSEQRLTVRNRGNAPVTFNLSSAGMGGRPHTLALGASTITVAPNAAVDVTARLTVAAATVGNVDSFREVAGLIKLTPASATANGGATLRVPYYMVPRARANLSTALVGPLDGSHPTTTAIVSNPNGTIAGDADFYAWGLTDRAKNLGSIDLRAVGVQSFPRGLTDKFLVFAVNTYNRWSTPNINEFDILIDTTGSGTPNYAVVGIDFGVLSGGGFSGQMIAAVVNLKTNQAIVRFFADAPTDGSTILLPVRASDLGLSEASPTFAYTAESTDLLTDAFDIMAGKASFNAWRSAISQAQFETVAPNATATVPVSIDLDEWQNTPALGLMVVTMDNLAGNRQAQVIPVRVEQRQE
jgi:hypothetical protein